MDEESTEEEDQEDDEVAVDEREVWQVTDVTEEDVETIEGETVDLYDKLMEMSCEAALRFWEIQVMWDPHKNEDETLKK